MFPVEVRHQPNADNPIPIWCVRYTRKGKVRSTIFSRSQQNVNTVAERIAARGDTKVTLVQDCCFGFTGMFGGNTPMVVGNSIRE